MRKSLVVCGDNFCTDREDILWIMWISKKRRRNFVQCAKFTIMRRVMSSLGVGREGDGAVS